MDNAYMQAETERKEKTIHGTRTCSPRCSVMPSSSGCVLRTTTGKRRGRGAFGDVDGPLSNTPCTSLAAKTVTQGHKRKDLRAKYTYVKNRAFILVFPGVVKANKESEQATSWGSAVKLASLPCVVAYQKASTLLPSLSSLCMKKGRPPFHFTSTC